MNRILLIYASEHGQTARIADRMARAARDAGAEVTVVEVGDAAGLRLGDHDVVVGGASVHAGHHQRSLTAWARRHAAGLAGMPSAFFSVSLTAAEQTAESGATTRGYLDQFLEETGWTPDLTVCFAGALQYREYDFMTRLLMRLMMRHGGHPTDTSRDYDYTDWEAVEKFGRRCAALAERVPAA